MGLRKTLDSQMINTKYFDKSANVKCEKVEKHSGTVSMTKRIKKKKKTSMRKIVQKHKS